MKKLKVLGIVALALGLTLALVATASATTATQDSNASISFTDGGIVIPPDPGDIDSSLNLLSINFGEHFIPIRSELYRGDGHSSSTTGHPAGAGAGTSGTGDNGVIMVTDQRATPAPWSLKLKATQFANSTTSNRFNATIWFGNPTQVVHGGGTWPSQIAVLNTSLSTGGFPTALASGFSPTPATMGITLRCEGTSGASDIQVFNATGASIPSGAFYLKFAERQIFMQAQGTGWNQMGNGQFTTSLTWTLTY